MIGHHSSRETSDRPNLTGPLPTSELYNNGFYEPSAGLLMHAWCSLLFALPSTIRITSTDIPFIHSFIRNIYRAPSMCQTPEKQQRMIRHGPGPPRRHLLDTTDEKYNNKYAVDFSGLSLPWSGPTLHSDWNLNQCRTQAVLASPWFWEGHLLPGPSMDLL